MQQLQHAASQSAHDPVERQPDQPARRQRDGGYLLLAILLMMALMIIAATVAAPRMVQQIKRDREEEMIHRGTEYARAIKKFYKKIRPLSRQPGRSRQYQPDSFPAQALQRSAHQRWQMEAAELRRHPDAAERQRAGNAGGSAGFARRRIDSGRRRVPSDFDRARIRQFGCNSSRSSPFSSGVAAPSSAAAIRIPMSFRSRQRGQTTGSTGFRQSRQSAIRATSGSQQNSSAFGQTRRHWQQPAWRASNPAEQLSRLRQNTTGGSQTFGGGAIVGVASLSKDPTIRIYNKKKTYNEWQFIYNPIMDQANVLLRGPYQPTTIGGAQMGTPAGQMNGQQQSAFGQQQTGSGSSRTALANSRIDSASSRYIAIAGRWQLPPTAESAHSRAVSRQPSVFMSDSRRPAPSLIRGDANNSCSPRKWILSTSHCPLPGKLHQQLQPLARVAAVDGVGRQRHGVADVVGVAGGDQRRGSIEQHHIAAAGALAIKDGANDGRILLRVAAGDFVQRRASASQNLPARPRKRAPDRCAPRQLCWGR